MILLEILIGIALGVLVFNIVRYVIRRTLKDGACRIIEKIDGEGKRYYAIEIYRKKDFWNDPFWQHRRSIYGALEVAMDAAIEEQEAYRNARYQKEVTRLQ